VAAQVLGAGGPAGWRAGFGAGTAGPGPGHGVDRLVPVAAGAVILGTLCAASMVAAAPEVRPQLLARGTPAVFWALAALAGAAEAALAPMDAPAGGAEPRPARRLALATGVMLLAVLTLAAAAIGSGDPPAPAAAAGAAMMAAGAILRAAAIRRLGLRFNSTNTIAAGAALERDGIYRWLAHPSEVGLGLIAGGAAMMAFAPAPALLLVPLWGVTLARVRFEEAALVRHHADAYRAYRRTTFDPLPRWL